MADVDVALESGIAWFTVISSSDLCAVDPFWVAWEAISASGDVLDRGVLQLAGTVHGEVLKVDVGAAVTKVNLLPVRNFTPVPISRFRTEKPSGLWKIECVIEGLQGIFKLRIPSETDGSYTVLLTASEGGKADGEADVGYPWTCVQAVKERGAGTFTVSNVVMTCVATGQRWGIIAEGVKAEHRGLTAQERKLVFAADSASWSYFTCFPIPF